MARANKALLPCSTQASMTELFNASESQVLVPILGTQQVYVAIKQVVALYSQTPFKCSIARSPEKVRAICAGKPRSHHFKTMQGFFCLFVCFVDIIVANAESGRSLLKEPLHSCSPPANRPYLEKKISAIKKSCLTLFFCV